MKHSLIIKKGVVIMKNLQAIISEFISIQNKDSGLSLSFWNDVVAAPLDDFLKPVLFNRVGNSTDFDDILQEARKSIFLLLQSGKYDCSRGLIKTISARILTNRNIDNIRSRVRNLKINKKLLIEAEHFSNNCRGNTDSPLDLAMFNEYKCRWLGIYSTLPERVKTILHDLQNYTIAEVKLKNGLSDSQYYRMINSVMTIVENKVFCESKS